MNDLIPVRCPFRRTTKTGSPNVCDQLIVKVYAGARGEGWCNRCKKSFEFDAMNVYAHGKDAFDEQAARIGELFAVPAAIAVQNAQVLAATKRLASRLQAAVNSQAIIDQAVGILMSRSGYTPDQAFDRLRQLSQTQNTKLSVVARSLVEEAVRRARSRHTDG